MENTRTVHGRAPTAPVAVSGPGDLRRDGYARYRPEDLGLSLAAHAGDLARLTAAYADLPADPYAPTTHRYRCYSHAVYLPWTRQLSFVPGAPDATYGTVTEYWQDGHNRGTRTCGADCPTSPPTSRPTRCCTSSTPTSRRSTGWRTCAGCRCASACT